MDNSRRGGLRFFPTRKTVENVERTIVGNFDSDANQANVGHSGNSNVDVHVNIEIDTKPVAYAMLCSLLATNAISHDEFNSALRKWEELTDENDKIKEKKKSDERPEIIQQNTVPGLRIFGPPKKKSQ
ncbi:hypothetical protein [Peribacillus sp. SCS-155]|uniref:hypothetical protein n=1 Tax=Peribacillus sedimenti TaxID=3115297 RepID=UPI003906A233